MAIIYRILILANAFLLFFSSEAWAYIGPGAGFAVFSSFLFLFLASISAFLTIFIWPFRALLLFLKRRKIREYRKVNRVVVIGLDGLDPTLVEQFIDHGMLPHFKRLKEKGSFSALRTTYPSMSPVAWSTFSTGVNPGKHRIFDFITRNPKNYLPVLSSTEISSYTRKIGIGPLRIPVRRTNVKFLRKSTSFWKILSKYGIFCSILRVPITFPPEKFYGTCLSGMCTPDLRGTQGAFTLLTSENSNRPKTDPSSEGTIIALRMDGTRFETTIPGPTVNTNGLVRKSACKMTGTVDLLHQAVNLKVAGDRVKLFPGKYSPWILLEFKMGFRKRISGITRFLITEMEPHLKIYLTPININPEKPALPVSHPRYFSTIISKLYGSFATVGLAEDTWALNERIIDEGTFLAQAYDIYRERREHLSDALRKNKDGLVVCVFDTADRIQHMFFRYLEDNHPANRDKDTEQYKDAIEKIYQEMDKLIGEVSHLLGENDVLLVVSDHGFKPFKWGVNLNSWLLKEGYLVLEPGALPGAEWLENVDWNHTRAFSIGLSGIFFNIRGRERYGCVAPGRERRALQLEIKDKLEALMDEKNGHHPIRRCILAQDAMKGPYVDDAPDMIIGYHEGYRASWNSAVGKITDQIIEDNTKSWSGDHCIDPDLVPGVFFSNWKLHDEKASMEDIAPTILSLFGLQRQPFHDGRVLNLSPH